MKSAHKIIRTEIRPYKKSLFFVFVLMLITVSLEAFAPWPFKLLIDNVLGGEPISSDFIGKYIIQIAPNPLAIGFLIVLLYFTANMMLSIFQFFESFTLKRILHKVIFNFSTSAFQNLENFSIGFYKKQSVGDYIYRLSYDVEAIGEFIEDGVLPILTSSLYLLVTTFIMFFIDVKLTLLSLSAIPFLTIGLYYFNKRADISTKESERYNSAVFSFVEQTLTQLKNIQSFSQEKNVSQKYNSKIHTSLKSDFEMYRDTFLLDLLVGTIIAISYSLIIARGITYVENNEITTGLLVVFIFYLDNLTYPILNIIFASSAIKQSEVKIARMKDFFENNTNSSTDSIREIDTTTINFDAVSLKGAEGTHILKKVSFTIKDGQTAVLVGVSGSGKTTIISLLPRLIDDPTGGEIKIGEYEIEKYDIAALRNTISYVPQDVVLFNDTIYNNIAFGNSHATKHQVITAAKLALAHDFIENHPNGYDFKVGEGGNYLSGGQRQRILLARAYMKTHAKIFIFDEPLSYLDLETRTKVWKNLREVTKGKTTIIVTNVIDTITEADTTIVIHEGTIIHQGTHTTLLKHPQYKKLVNA